MSQQSLQVSRKLTVKGIVGSPAGLVTAEKPRLLIARIYGTVQGAKPDESQYGEYVRFTGNFRGVNLLTGEASSSPSCILPETAEQLVFNAFNQLDKGSELNFAFDFALEHDADPRNARGYKYVTVTLLAEESDTLRAIAGLLPAIPSLPDLLSTPTSALDETQSEMPEHVEPELKPSAKKK
jgi:hypothetical protein